MSATVAMNQKLVWAKGFGYADLESKIEASPDTPYHLASVSKTLAAKLITQLTDQPNIREVILFSHLRTREG